MESFLQRCRVLVLICLPLGASSISIAQTTADPAVLEVTAPVSGAIVSHGALLAMR
jgi:hypothetical protein